jgi:hypothetical protein
MSLLNGSSLAKPKLCVQPMKAPSFASLYFELYKEKIEE